MNDFEYQVAFVVEAAERLLALLDRDPLSPTYGCAHPCYWRDKSSELADMRRQEAMLPLALLYVRAYPGSPWQGQERLLTAISALLSFWCRNQYAEGAMDEWYKGERAFAAPAFTAHAVARTLHLVGDYLPPTVVTEARRCLKSVGDWLAHHNDLFKTNHQAVAVAALHWVGRVLEHVGLQQEAQRKLQTILATQSPEGWFSELGHMDVGYTFLTVEYLAMANAVEQPLVKAFDFACGWVHPDLTVGLEYGVCHNGYLSRIGVVLMAPFSRYAARLLERLTSESVGFAGLMPTLADDLRLTRWAFQPLLAWDYWQGREEAPVKPLATPLRLPLENPEADPAFFAEAALIRLQAAGGQVLFAPVAGGLVRLFGDENQVLTDDGYVLTIKGGFATNSGYNRECAIFHDDQSWSVKVPLVGVRKFFPSLLQRLILRLLCTTAMGSRLARRGIDWLRRRKATPINQSSTNLAGGRAHGFLLRQVTFAAAGLEVRDHLTFPRRIAVGDVSASFEGTPTPLTTLYPELSDTVTYLTLIKSYRRHNGRWHVTERRAEGR